MTLKEDDPFDFGFTTSDVVEDLKPEVNKAEQKLATVKKMIFNLLDNLAKDPDKPTLHWPNRADKVKQFKAELSKVFDK